MDQDIFIFTDASKLYWSGVIASGQAIATEEITNILKSQASAISEKLSMRPMYFVSGAFKGSQYHWSMPDKEMYPILKILLRFRFITMSHPRNIKVFCDHKNMEYLLNPPRTLKAAAISRLYRWVLLLQNFKLTVFHLKGEFNKFADIMSRWAHLGQSIEEIEEQERAKELFRPNRTKNKRVSGTIELIDPPDVGANWLTVAQYVARVSSDEALKPVLNSPYWSLAVERWSSDADYNEYLWKRISFLSPACQEKWEPITEDEILSGQQEEISGSPGIREKLGLKYDSEENVWKKGRKIYVPKELRARMLIYNHVIMGHTSVETELENLRNFYLGNPESIRRELGELHRVCLHCDKHPALIRRPLHEIPHARRPNQVLHADNLKVRSDYLLVLIDDYTRKVWLEYTESPTVEPFVRSLLAWRGHFGLSNSFVICTDQGSHFANRVTEEFEKKLPHVHRYSVVYAPWTNGSAEVINALILKYLRNLCSQYMLADDDWPLLIELIVNFINNKPNPRRNGLSPNAIHFSRDREGYPLFLGNERLVTVQARADLVPVLVNFKFVDPVDEDEVLRNLQKLSEQLEKSDKKVYKLIEKERQRNREKVNRKIKAGNIQYQPGEYVLVSSKGVTRRKNKLKLNWTGPWVIVGIPGDNVYDVRDPLGNQKSVHAARVRYYDGKNFKMSEEVKKVYTFNRGVFEVDKIIGLRANGHDYEMLVFWKGFEISDSTWENVKDLYTDIPTRVVEYLMKERDTNPLAEHLYEMYGQAGEEANVILETFPGSAAGEKRRNKFVIKPSAVWTPGEVDILEDCIRAYGMGNWAPILDGNHLTGKSKADIILKVQEAIQSEHFAHLRGLKLTFEVMKSYEKERRQERNRLRRARKLPPDAVQDRIHAGTMLRRKQSPLKVREIRRLSWDEIKGLRMDLKEKLKTLKQYWSSHDSRAGDDGYDSEFGEPADTEDELDARGAYCVEHVTKANAQVLQVEQKSESKLSSNFSNPQSARSSVSLSVQTHDGSWHRFKECLILGHQSVVVVFFIMLSVFP